MTTPPRSVSVPPTPAQKGPPVVLISVLVAVVFVICAAGALALAFTSIGDDRSTNHASGSTYGLNQPARDGQFQFTVTNVQQGTNTWTIEVTIINVGDRAQTFYVSTQRAYSTSGAQYNPDQSASTGDAVSLNPGLQHHATLVYDVPPTAKLDNVRLHDSLFSVGVTVTV